MNLAKGIVFQYCLAKGIIMEEIGLAKGTIFVKISLANSITLNMLKNESKESQGMVTSRGKTRVALLRLAFCYSVVPLRSGHKPIPYEDRKRNHKVWSHGEEGPGSHCLD